MVASSEKRAICWGEVLWDLFPDARRLGGAPSNVAFHLAAMGQPVSMITRVGDDGAGRDITAALSAAGIDVSLVQRDAERPTGCVEVHLEEGEPTYTLRPGCAWERIELGAAASRAIAGSAALIFGTLSQRQKAGLRSWRGAIAAAPGDCLRVCDLNFRPGHIDFSAALEAIGAADVLKLNEGEAAALSENAGESSLEWIFDRGPRLIALTRGERGCVLRTRERSIQQAGFAAGPGGDNVGAGDAFTAALTRGLLLELELEAIAEGACRYGAFVASHRGATPTAGHGELPWPA